MLWNVLLNLLLLFLTTIATTLVIAGLVVWRRFDHCLEEGPPVQTLETDLVSQLLEDVLSSVTRVDIQRL